MQLKDIIQKTTVFLREKGSQSARLDTELLLSAALNWERIKLYLNYEYPLTEDELKRCREFVRRRASGEPVAYILGKKDFYNHTFKVTPAVLIPRPETEIMVEEAIAYAKQLIANQPSLEAVRIVDLGIGSGCIGLSVLAEVDKARLFGVDISSEAVAVAQENSHNLSVSERAKIVVGNASELEPQRATEALGGSADLLLANPPYIDFNDPLVEPNVKKFEPNLALFSEEGGLSHIRHWSALAKQITRPGSLIMFEIGRDQGPQAYSIFASQDCFQNIQIVKDLSDQDRFVRAIRTQEN
jgi:release factor glutamine methyltransferase